MNERQEYLIEVINLVPDESILFIQAPSIKNSSLIDLMTSSLFEYYTQIVLTQINKKEIIKIVINENIQEYFQSIEIQYHDKLLFVGYDGMEFGLCSEELNLSNSFIDEYITKNEMCRISKSL